ncbi:MAG: hypothetical protein PHO32_01370 [Candidatus Cloacimonetes bacterium]|nr:hypothetical protein [Candidatus Cloacimonadota bacterium]
MNREYKEIRPQTSENEINDMIEKVARFIAERHFAPAGILFLESVRPLHGIGSQAMFFILPFAEIIFDSKKYQRFALLIENEENLKKMIARMDELDEELSRDARKASRLKRQRRKAKFKAFVKKIFKPHKNNA